MKNVRESNGTDVQILKIISDNELFIFGIEDLLTLADRSYSDLKYALSTLCEAGLIYRLEQGLYCMRNYKNTYPIANLLLKDSAIAYWSALNLHGLTEQIPNVVYSQSSFRKDDKTI
ncbi:MAG: hypothetical protein LBD59_12175, partial [Prevotellaceae bacterium]|nr:hypothetical protein [Prevotellaceae bacterium]